LASWDGRPCAGPSAAAIGRERLAAAERRVLRLFHAQQRISFLNFGIGRVLEERTQLAAAPHARGYVICFREKRI